MCSSFEHVIKSCSNPSISSSDKIVIINQYISTSDIHHRYVKQLAQDPNLNQFSNLLFQIFSEIKFDSRLSNQYEEFTKSVASYITQICLKSPYILDLFASSPYLNNIIVNTFGNLVSSGNILTIEPTTIFPYVKMLAILCMSNEVAINSAHSLEVLCRLISHLITHPQLSAWVNAILSGVVRHSSSAEEFVRSQRNLVQIKKELMSLLSANDICVVCSALCASTLLFPPGNDCSSSIKAAINFISTNTKFPIMRHLASMIIQSLTKFIRIDIAGLTTIMNSILNEKGIGCHAIIQLLFSMTDYYEVIGSVLKSTKFISSLINFLLNSEDDYVAVAGCHFILTIFNIVPSLFESLPDNKIFEKSFASFMNLDNQASAEKRESHLLLLSAFIKSELMTSHDVSTLQMYENDIFTGFLRHVELGNEYLAVCYYIFLMHCKDYIQQWDERIRLIVLDSQFICLCISVLFNSQTRMSITNALLSLKDILIDQSILSRKFFDSTVTGFLIFNNKSKENTDKVRYDFEKKINELNNVIDRLSGEKNVQTKRINALIEENSSMKDNIQHKIHQAETIGDREERIQQLEKQVRLLQNENVSLQEKLTESAVRSRSAIHNNKDIINQLELVQQSDKDKQNQLFKRERELKAVNDLVMSLRLQLDEKDNQLSIAQSRSVAAESKAQQFEKRYKDERELTKRLVRAAEKLREDLFNEQTRSAKLSQDLETIEQSKRKLQLQVKDIEAVKNKYNEKTDEVRQKMYELEREKNKWESIAKFSNKIKKSKYEAQQEVFNPLF